MDSDNRFINTSQIRREDQRIVMDEIEKQGHCPFCKENINRYHKNPILKEGKFWILTENQWPYYKVKNQLLAIYKIHIENIKDIDPEAGKELFEMFSEKARERNMSGGGICMRFGHSDKGTYGGTVTHIHAHLIEPDLEALEEKEIWQFKLGQRKG